MANNHLLFEEWLLSETNLTPEEHDLLQEHLKSCESCRLFSDSWQEAEYHLKEAPRRSPEPGFTGRWEARLAADYLRRNRRQTIYFLSLGSGAALLLLTILGVWSLPLVRNPIPYLMIWGYQLITTFYKISGVGQALGTVLSALFELVPRTLWIALLVALSSLGVIWIVAFRKLTTLRRVIV